MNIKLGYNFAGFFENRNEIADSDVELFAQSSLIYERAPGGAITSKVNPAKYRNGWGINRECIDAVLPEGAVDEDGNGRDKWIQRMNEQPNYSYIDDMIGRHALMPNLRLIWVANCLSASAEDNMSVIRELINAGVRITHVEADNEAYGKDKYQDFGEYATKFQPLFDMIHAEFPDVKCSICLAPFTKGVAAHDAWNTAAFNYDSAHAGKAFDTATIHFYYDDRNLEDAPGIGDAFQLFPKDMTVLDIVGGEGDSRMDSCWQSLRTGLMNNGGWIDEIESAKEMFPRLQFIVTEFNTHPSEYFCNTLVNEAWIFMMYLMRDSRIDALCVHNGNSPALYGRWTRTFEQDSVMGNPNAIAGSIRRLGAFAMQLLSEIDEVNNFPVSDVNHTIASEGKYYAWFCNLEEADIPHIFSLPVGYKMVATPTINYLQGSRLYSSSGSAGWMNKRQPASYEINGIKRGAYTELLPKLSFGYYYFEVVKETPPTTGGGKPKGWIKKWLESLGHIFRSKQTTKKYAFSFSRAEQYALQVERIIY